ncbi:hypothetical protein L7F22_020266 [Adiantum nelumboides]|nr:hypothetical protein [Adiantum nelumboides]
MAKQYDMDFNTVLKTRLEELQRLVEIRQRALLEQQIVQQRRKYWHDSKIKVREFRQGDLVLLHQSKLGPKKPNLKIAWSRPYEVDWVFSNGTVRLKDLSGLILPGVYNGTKIKLYYSAPNDLNMQSPKAFSISGDMGAGLLCHPKIAHDVLTTLRRKLETLVTCKTCLLKTTKATIELAKRLKNTGILAITIHNKSRIQGKIFAVEYKMKKHILMVLR